MSEEVPVGRLVSIIVSVLAAALLLSLAGLVVLGALEGNAEELDNAVTHDRIVNVFVALHVYRPLS